MSERCSRCDYGFLIINSRGYPIEEEVKRLESEGHVVNIQGCVPPEINEEAYKYECRACGHKFGEYGE